MDKRFRHVGAQKTPRSFFRNCEGLLKYPRRYLLSRLLHYHRLRKLNFCVRYGNRCGLSDMVTGKDRDGPVKTRRGKSVVGIDGSSLSSGLFSIPNALFGVLTRQPGKTRTRWEPLSASIRELRYSGE